MVLHQVGGKKDVRVMFGMPTHGLMPVETAMSMLSLHTYDYETRRYLRSSRTVGMSIIHWGRNVIVKDFLLFRDKAGRPLTHLLFMDSDMVAPMNGLEKLVEADSDIVSGLFTNRQSPCRAELRRMGEDGQFQHVQIPPDEAGLQVEPLVDVDATGMAFTLVRREVFQQLKAPWFEFCQAPNQKPGADYQEFGEDVYFCWKAKQAKLQVRVRMDLPVGHCGQYVFDVRDVWAGQVQLAAAAAGD